MKNIALREYNPKQTSLPIVVKETTQKFYQPLWLCIHFPKLAAHSLQINIEQPFVIYEANTQKRIIYYASTSAQQLGIEAGMDLNKAYVLCQHIRAYTRDQKQEKTLIKALADWALCFSSHVSTKYDASILIEIRGSLKLFNGIAQLQKKITQQLHRKGYLSSIAVAPTPLASFILSKAARNIIIENKIGLRAELGKLDLYDFLIDRKNLEKLQNIGIKKGYELLRLPSASLARRLGSGFCRYLNELLGITHEHITPIRSRYSFYEYYELPKDQEDLEIILIHVNILLKSLIRFLIQRDSSTRELRFTIHLVDHQQIAITIGSSIQCRNERIWKNLIREKFYSTSFSSSVTKISLYVDKFDSYIPNNKNTLHNDTHSNHPDWETILDQLAARLGRKCISTLDTIEDYRPEYSYAKKTYASKQHFKKIFQSHPYRPTWLLEKPLRINTSINKLQKSSNVERIEDGWWDQNPIRRDYFIAKNKNNSLLWVFADLEKHGQHFIHGYFA